MSTRDDKREFGLFQVDQAFARILEIDRDPVADHRLDLTDPPIGRAGEDDKLAGLKRTAERLPMSLLQNDVSCGICA